MYVFMYVYVYVSLSLYIYIYIYTYVYVCTQIADIMYTITSRIRSCSASHIVSCFVMPCLLALRRVMSCRHNMLCHAVLCDDMPCNELTPPDPWTNKIPH